MSVDSREVLPKSIQEAEESQPPFRQDETLDDGASVGTIDNPPSAQEGLPPFKIYPPLSFPVIVLLIPASIFGVLARLGLQALATYDGHSIFPLAYAQAVGCLIMGFCLEMKEPFGRFYGPLYTAFTTGFCGSLTTFSGWQLDVFNSWINSGRFHRGGLRDFIDGVAKTAFTISLSISSLTLGSRLAFLSAPYFPAAQFPHPITRYSLSAIAVLCYAATFPVYFRLPASYRHQATAALLFGFPGALSRYVLSIYLNPKIKSFPLGTFTANMLGTSLLGAFHALQGRNGPVSANTCSILQGLADGYSGCLTTISTFAAETSSMSMSKGARYVFISWAGGQLLLLVILGPSFWAGGVHEQATCRFTG